MKLIIMFAMLVSLSSAHAMNDEFITIGNDLITKIHKAPKNRRWSHGQNECYNMIAWACLAQQSVINMDLKKDDDRSSKLGFIKNVPPQRLANFINDRIPVPFLKRAQAISRDELDISGFMDIVKDSIDHKKPLMAYVLEGATTPRLSTIIGYNNAAQIMLLSADSTDQGRKVIHANDFLNKMNFRKIRDKLLKMRPSLLDTDEVLLLLEDVKAQLGIFNMIVFEE